jgi:hypothetical protein
METIRYIVRARGDNATLAEFLAALPNEPGLELVDTIGPAQGPHTAVVAVPADLAPSFEQRFRNSQQLMIERDRPLSLFDKTAGFLHRSERNTNG